MFRKVAGPKWWQLYLTFPLLIGLFMVDHRLRISMGGHEAVQLGILAVVFGAIHLWLRANSAALSGLDQKRYRGRFKVTRIVVHELHEPIEEDHPMFEFPGSEIRGLLETEFEIEDAQGRAFPARDHRHEVKKD